MSKKVHGKVDDYLVGGDIWLNINDQGVEFDMLTDGNVILFIEKHKKAKKHKRQILKKVSNTTFNKQKTFFVSFFERFNKHFLNV